MHARARFLLPFVAICAGALIVRGVAWARMAVLFDDGPLFLYIADAIANGEWSSVLRHPYHPLYPLAIAGVAPFVGGDLEQAGAVVSIVSGTAAVAFLAVFLYDAFSRNVAIVGSAMLAFHPFAVEFSCDVQSEGPYLALLLASVALSWRAIDRESVRLAACAGLASALAYLVRPEGLGIVAVNGGAAALLWLRGHWTFAGATRWCAAVALGALLVAGPYVVLLHEETGVWSLTQKKSVGALLSLSADGSLAEASYAEPQDDEPLPVQKSLTHASRTSDWRTRSIAERLLPAYSEFWKAAVSGIRVEAILLALLGIWQLRGRPGRRAWFIAAVVLLYTAVLYALAMNAGYVSRRHALPAFVLLLGYAGVGALWGVDFCLGRIGRFATRPASWRDRTAVVVAVALVAAMWLPRDVRSRRDERLAERLAAEWLREHDPQAGAVASGRLRVAYYAGAEFVPIPPLGSPGAEAPLLGYLQDLGARYVIVDEEVADQHAGLRQARSAGLELMHREQARGYSAIVFAVPPSPR